MYELYALIDPLDSRIRYIGYTSKPKTRLRDHINQSFKSRNKISHKSNWINKLDKENKKPLYKTLIRVNSLNEVKQLEIDYIKYYKNIYSLTNNTIGGDGVNGLKWSEESKAKIKGRIIPNATNVYLKVEALNSITGEYIIFNNKLEAAKYINCSPGSITGVSCGQRNSVNKWFVSTIKKGAQ